MVDTEGFPVVAVVHTAGLQDRQGADIVGKVLAEKAPSVRHVWADGGYTGTGKRRLEVHGVNVEIVLRSNDRARGQWRTPQMDLFTVPRGFILMRRRWVVERSFGWLGRNRRMSKDYEGTIWASTSWIFVAFARILTQRLAHD